MGNQAVSLLVINPLVKEQKWHHGLDGKQAHFYHPRIYSQVRLSQVRRTGMFLRLPNGNTLEAIHEINLLVDQLLCCLAVSFLFAKSEYRI